MSQPIKGVSRTEDFVSLHLPDLVGTADDLYALFATYNSILGYDGVVETGKPHLDVVVRAGYRLLGEGGRFLIGDPEVEDLPSGSQVLAVVYAGLSAWEQALSFARDIRVLVPRATVVVLTCDCRRAVKMERFAPLLLEGEIDWVVFDHQCGGASPMKKILEAVIRLRQ